MIMIIKITPKTITVDDIATLENMGCGSGPNIDDDIAFFNFQNILCFGDSKTLTVVLIILLF